MSDIVRLPFSGRRAVVLGGSLAGMLAARVLADSFDVVVLERDDMQDGSEARRGVPQGRHVHALLARGGAAFEELFPGIADELIEAGAVTGDVLADTTWCPHGYPLRNVPCGLRALSASRSLIEDTVRRRVSALPRVALRPGIAAVELVAAADRVRGVRVRSTRDNRSAYLKADLIVDATGRGSRTPEWLNAIGFPRPAENRVVVQLRYASRTYRVSAEVMRAGPRSSIHRPRGARAARLPNKSKGTVFASASWDTAATSRSPPTTGCEPSRRA